MNDRQSAAFVADLHELCKDGWELQAARVRCIFHQCGAGRNLSLLVLPAERGSGIGALTEVPIATSEALRLDVGTQGLLWVDGGRCRALRIGCPSEYQMFQVTVCAARKRLQLGLLQDTLQRELVLQQQDSARKKRRLETASKSMAHSSDSTIGGTCRLCEEAPGDGGLVRHPFVSTGGVCPTK